MDGPLVFPESARMDGRRPAGVGAVERACIFTRVPEHTIGLAHDNPVERRESHEHPRHAEDLPARSIGRHASGVQRSGAPRIRFPEFLLAQVARSAQ